jgi:SAM-dependent methyltransferase
MINGKLTLTPFSSDTHFDKLYPVAVSQHAKKHWTPLYIARKAANFLAPGTGARVLDIGSGVGKFCLAAAHYKPAAFFCGVEQRISLVYQANKLNEKLRMKNVSFMHGNFTELDFRRFDHFYFYNSFYENLVGTDKIDDSIHYSAELYQYYNRYLYKQLDKKPAGTRLATFHSLEDEVPPGYQVVDSEADNLLKLWIRT